MWPFNIRFPQKSEISAGGQWSVPQGEYNGRLIFARENRGLAELVGHPEYRTQVGVAVPFLKPPEMALQRTRSRFLTEAGCAHLDSTVCASILTPSKGQLGDAAFYDAPAVKPSDRS